MSGTSRLLALMARREKLRAGQTAAAAAAAQRKADAAAALAGRLSAVLSEAEPGGPRRAAEMQNRHRLLLDIAGECARQREQARIESENAAIQRKALERHMRKRTKLEEAADRSRTQDAAEREARARSLLPERGNRR
jgi:hypothetical protein